MTSSGRQGVDAGSRRPQSGNLDVGVSVDAAVAHLAAGMGKPVLLPNFYDNCWRWLHGRTNSPWCPTLQVHRQPSPGG